MELHHGQIIEKVIRREGYSISEVARFTKVNRRSVYYWFNQQFLKAEIIYKIGMCLKHDFSVEFPHLFKSDDFKKMSAEVKFVNAGSEVINEPQGSAYWKDKYLELLENYNELLIRNAEEHKTEKENILRMVLPDTNLKSK
ncbi:hypothetical protein [Mucilaginibacter sp.]|jgi:hypothetical protein|uniref:hypothetical protein n=1 Tax=Mucilaginibacter sp. TaxID=1882438 RepID=UPI0025EC83D9|nr:hypothetical protein [Mucilaginibacter sp.]